MRNKAFTLVELLVVVAILGALATFAAVRLTGAQTSARDSRRMSDLRQYQNSLEIYASRSNSLYPVRTTTVNIATALCGTLGLTNCPTDPNPSGSSFYSYQTNASGINYVLWARLERPNASGAAENFVLCSNGNVGRVAATVAIAGGNCPI